MSNKALTTKNRPARTAGRRSLHRVHPLGDMCNYWVVGGGGGGGGINAIVWSSLMDRPRDKAAETIMMIPDIPRIKSPEKTSQIEINA